MDKANIHLNEQEKGLPEFKNRSKGAISLSISMSTSQNIWERKIELFEQLRTIQQKRTKGAL